MAELWRGATVPAVDGLDGLVDRFAGPMDFFFNFFTRLIEAGIKPPL